MWRARFRAVDGTANAHGPRHVQRGPCGDIRSLAVRFHVSMMIVIMSMRVTVRMAVRVTMTVAVRVAVIAVLAVAVTPGVAVHGGVAHLVVALHPAAVLRVAAAHVPHATAGFDAPIAIAAAPVNVVHVAAMFAMTWVPVGAVKDPAASAMYPVRTLVEIALATRVPAAAYPDVAKTVPAPVATRPEPAGPRGRNRSEQRRRRFEADGYSDAGRSLRLRCGSQHARHESEAAQCCKFDEQFHGVVSIARHRLAALRKTRMPRVALTRA